MIDIVFCTVFVKRVAYFGISAQKGGKFHPKLNMTTRLIANKYREGKVKRTLKRELKVLEIVKGEANIAVEFCRRVLSASLVTSVVRCVLLLVDSVIGSWMSVAKIR